MSLRSVIRRRDRSRGQSVVEFALVLPILLLLLAATIDFGRLFYLYVAVNNAAKEGALYGARSPLCDDDSNPACGDPNNVAWHVANEASNLVDSNGNSLLATTVACRDTSGVLVQPINNCVDGYTYQVTVTSPFTLITPMISNIVGQTIVLRSESQATVISDAFDPTGLEALIWVDKTGSQNAADITTACIQADSVSSAGYYYQPCQDGTNVDNYLQFQENSTVNYKVRVRNTGNINLTGITYAFTINGVSVGKPGNCSTLPASLTAGSGAFYCTFSRTATSVNPGNGIDDDTVSIAAAGSAAGLPTGATNGGATIKVAPAPHLATNIQAAQYRLGDDGDGNNGVVNYSNGGMALKRDTASTLPEIQNPTGWFYLTVVNTGWRGEQLQRLGDAGRDADQPAELLRRPDHARRERTAGRHLHLYLPADLQRDAVVRTGGDGVRDERRHRQRSAADGHRHDVRRVDVLRRPEGRPQPGRYSRSLGGRDEQDDR